MEEKAIDLSLQYATAAAESSILMIDTHVVEKEDCMIRTSLTHAAMLTRQMMKKKKSMEDTEIDPFVQPNLPSTVEIERQKRLYNKDHHFTLANHAQIGDFKRLRVGELLNDTILMSHLMLLERRNSENIVVLQFFFSAF